VKVPAPNEEEAIQVINAFANVMKNFMQ